MGLERQKRARQITVKLPACSWPDPRKRAQKKGKANSRRQAAFLCHYFASKSAPVSRALAVYMRATIRRGAASLEQRPIGDTIEGVNEPKKFGDKA